MKGLEFKFIWGEEIENVDFITDTKVFLSNYTENTENLSKATNEELEDYGDYLFYQMIDYNKYCWLDEFLKRPIDLKQIGIFIVNESELLIREIIKLRQDEKLNHIHKGLENLQDSCIRTIIAVRSYYPDIETSFKDELYELKTRESFSKVNPFRNMETRKLFDYLVQNWNNTSANKWGYIWEFLFTNGNGKLTNKSEYENYIRTKHDFTKGKANYDSCNSKIKYSELEELKRKYEEHLVLD